MNKKGFTTLELLLTMVLVVGIMVTITNVTYVYRDRSEYEELLTEITNYKNTLTKIIYDDILSKNNRSNRVTKIVRNSTNSYTLETPTRNIPLYIYNLDDKVGISYDSVDYIVPGSEDEFVTIEDITYHPDPILEKETYEDPENTIYSLEIVFKHRNLNELFKIKFAVS